MTRRTLFLARGLACLFAIAIATVGCRRTPPPCSGGTDIPPVTTNGSEPGPRGALVSFPGGAAFVADVARCEVSRIDDKVGVGWRRSVTPCDGRLAIAVGPDSNAYARTPSTLVAFGFDGSERWRITAGTEPVPASIFAPTTTLDSLVVVASSTHALLALKPDGTEAWRFRVSEDEPIIAPPAGGGGEGAFLLTVRALYLVGSDGSVRWRRDTASAPKP